MTVHWYLPWEESGRAWETEIIATILGHWEDKIEAWVGPGQEWWDPRLVQGLSVHPVFMCFSLLHN